MSTEQIVITWLEIYHNLWTVPHMRYYLMISSQVMLPRSALYSGHCYKQGLTIFQPIRTKQDNKLTIFRPAGHNSSMMIALVKIISHFWNQLSDRCNVQGWGTLKNIMVGPISNHQYIVHCTGISININVWKRSKMGLMARKDKYHICVEKGVRTPHIYLLTTTLYAYLLVCALLTGQQINIYPLPYHIGGYWSQTRR